MYNYCAAFLKQRRFQDLIKASLVMFIQASLCGCRRRHWRFITCHHHPLLPIAEISESVARLRINLRHASRVPPFSRIGSISSFRSHSISSIRKRGTR